MTGRVLVAEDDRAMQEIVFEYLRDEGFEVDIANNGAEALLLARKSPPDMAVVDVFMPVMDGRALLATWTRDPTLHVVPVVVVSATPGLADLALQFDVRATLAKPFDLQDLGALVRQVLEVRPKSRFRHES
jgi:DNA-binding response OmpR family regulator